MRCVSTKSNNINTMENELWDVDRELFRRMKSECQSENERAFFETMCRKQENEGVLSIDRILNEADNDDGLFLDRYWFQEYKLGSIPAKTHLHTMNLTDALNTNLKTVGLLGRDITFFEWLRERDYNCVRYDRNEDMF